MHKKRYVIESYARGDLRYNHWNFSGQKYKRNLQQLKIIMSTEEYNYKNDNIPPSHYTIFCLQLNDDDRDEIEKKVLEMKDESFKPIFKQFVREEDTNITMIPYPNRLQRLGTYSKASTNNAWVRLKRQLKVMVQLVNKNIVPKDYAILWSKERP